MECAKSELRGKVTKIALKAGNLISHSSTHFIPLQTLREKRILPLFARNPGVAQWRNVKAPVWNVEGCWFESSRTRNVFRFQTNVPLITSTNPVA